MKRSLLKKVLLLGVGLFISLGLMTNFANIVYGGEREDKRRNSGIGHGITMAHYFPLNQGDTWEYKVSSDDGEENQGRVKIDGTEIVNGVETKKRYEFLYPDYQDENYYKCVAQNSEGFVWYKEVNIKDGPPAKFFNPPYVYLALKMRIGQTSTSYWLDTRSIDPRGTTICGRTIELEGIETVTVPAGRFKGCLKIKYCEFNNDEEDPPGHRDEAWKGWIWLARGVGIVKGIEYGAGYLPDEQKTETWTDTIELTSYKINNVTE